MKSIVETLSSNIIAIYNLAIYNLLFLLRDGDEDGTFHDGVALLHFHLLNLSVAVGVDVVLHLHGFEHHNGLAFLHSLSDSHLDVVNSAWQRCANGRYACLDSLQLLFGSLDGLDWSSHSTHDG